MDCYKEYVFNQLPEGEQEILRRLGLTLDSCILAEFWPSFVGFEKRRRTEISFLEQHIPSRGIVFDACLGSGATTIGLQKAGYTTISNEIDPEFLEVAKREARKEGVTLHTTSHDWRGIPTMYAGQFDAVVCVGNSLTYVFKKEERRKVLTSFSALLRPEGKLIIDERNYTHHFFPKEAYKHSGNVVYCGDKVSAYPIHVSEAVVVMEYTETATGKKAHLVLYPFRENELRTELAEAGFRNIAVFGDYNPIFKSETPEFLTYVATK